MLASLPSNTDFYSAAPRSYPAAKLLAVEDPAAWLLPLPRELKTVAVADAAASARPTRSVTTRAGDETERELARLGAKVPDHAEGYAIARVRGERVLASRSNAGLLRGQATLAQLDAWTARRGGAAADVCISDSPATGIRFLGGWALWRAHGLRDAIDLAWAFKANRVLYNAWGWIPGDAVAKEDAWLVTHARERGIELVFELRRMSFGREHRIADPENRRKILDVYSRAAEAGFRSFGLLFDDVPWETADDECALAEDVLGAVAARVSSPELFVCPQHYWYPGQMNSTWSGRANPQETAAQRAYLETYGRRLPRGAHVYIANFWGDHPERHEQALRSEFTDLVGRRPIFFDNQLVNDYRHGALYPFALQFRPASLGESYAGHYLNCGLPLAAYAAPAATALACAWNPAAYDPERAMGAALRWVHAPSDARAAHAVEGLNRLRALVNEWAGGTHTAVSHHATIWRQLREGKVGAREVEGWKGSVRSLRDSWLAALREPAPGARTLSIASLLALARDSHRLERDLDFFAAFLERKRRATSEPSDPGALAGFEGSSNAYLAATLDDVRAILPPAPGLDPLLADPASLPPAEAQAWSWVEYFASSTRRTLLELSAEMLGKLRPAP